MMPMQDLSGSATHSVHSSGLYPTDDQIVDAVRRILVNADLSTTTKKAIRAQLAQDFNVDLSAKKEFISKVVDQMLIGS
ncbi:hypothetical protein IWW36_004928 [Coemansia brasiliensis]|uniref:DEK-C domain-containing protein n=1 Tax=Coemansia brasiliensis TaxID=2650707 RepID=A0A9W8I505_9FUNG|nr:hypothetical protein IWW36_004928 [Coemansia brasiliensis]